MVKKSVKLFIKALLYGLLINIGLQLISEPIPPSFTLDLEQPGKAQIMTTLGQE